MYMLLLMQLTEAGNPKVCISVNGKMTRHELD